MTKKQMREAALQQIDFTIGQFDFATQIEFVEITEHAAYKMIRMAWKCGLITAEESEALHGEYIDKSIEATDRIKKTLENAVDKMNAA